MLLTLIAKVLEVMFGVGMIGSAVVVVMTTVSDLKHITGKSDE